MRIEALTERRWIIFFLTLSNLVFVAVIHAAGTGAGYFGLPQARSASIRLRKLYILNVGTSELFIKAKLTDDLGTNTRATSGRPRHSGRQLPNYRLDRLPLSQWCMYRSDQRQRVRCPRWHDRCSMSAPSYCRAILYLDQTKLDTEQDPRSTACLLQESLECLGRGGIWLRVALCFR